MKIPFVKYHGAGNDFILIDDRSLSFPVLQTDLIASLCRRCFGIGADGLILLQPSSCADFRMRIFNSDGSEPAMCGNGIRCLTAFIRKLGWSPSSCAIETQAGVLRCFLKGEKIGIELGLPRVLFKEHALHIDGKEILIDVIDTGVAHGVVFTNDLAKQDISSSARAIRFHPQFSPDGINVNFVQVLPDKSLLVRTYERGVEEETISCGTGAAAASWLASQRWGFHEPVKVHNNSQTHTLEVRCSELSGIELWGEACEVFEGLLSY